MFPVSLLTRRWPEEGWPKGLSSFSREWGEFLFETNIVAAGHILEASIHEKLFRLDLPSGPKIRQREGAGGVAHPPLSKS